MAYSENLAARIREALKGHGNIEEQPKMGGISFMVDGKMCMRAHSAGNMMLRCAPELTEELLLKKGVSRFEMKGKPMMKGWLLVSEAGFRSKKDFDFWMNVALAAGQKAKPAKKK